ncbi:MAG: M28 family metallopeptidase [Armatimonadia bacterium]
MSAARFKVQPDQVMKHAEYLADTLGERLAGGEGEQRAADYIQSEMNRIGLQDVHQQSFTCKWYDVRHASMQARFGGQWRSVTMDAVAHTPSTQGEIEAELVYVGEATEDILDHVDLHDKVALVHGTYGPNAKMLRRFAQVGVAAAIWTDVRYTSDWNILVGLPWSFLPLLTFPAASVPFTVECELVEGRADRVRLNLDTVVEDRQSQNVIGTLAGRSDAGGVLVSGHHDSVRLSVGAEDNAAGVAVTLAVAEALKGVPLEKPIRFVSFGTEEQLSQGSFAYVEEPRYRAEQLDLVLNTDGQGCWTGVSETYVTGSVEFHEYMRGQLAAHEFPGTMRHDPDAFSDHFPFMVRGVPAVWFYRRNCPGGRWFHHSIYDTINRLSPDLLSHCASMVADIAADIAGQRDLPFERRFPEKTQQEVQAVADGWLKI